MDTELKQCSMCKEHKTLDLFNNNKSNKDGKQSYCKSCNTANKRVWKKANPEKVAAHNRAWKKANPEKAAANARAWVKANPESTMLCGAKLRAKKSNLAFNLTIEDIQIPEYCPILGIKLEQRNGRSDNSPSLDKIYPDKGYVKGNVQVISDLANRMKQNATFAQMVMLGKYAEPFTEKA
jgi:hypothetical protein